MWGEELGLQVTSTQGVHCFLSSWTNFHWKIIQILKTVVREKHNLSYCRPWKQKFNDHFWIFCLSPAWGRSLDLIMQWEDNFRWVNENMPICCSKVRRFTAMRLSQHRISRMESRLVLQIWTCQLRYYCPGKDEGSIKCGEEFCHFTLARDWITSLILANVCIDGHPQVSIQETWHLCLRLSVLLRSELNRRKTVEFT